MDFFNAHLHWTGKIPPTFPGIYNSTDESQWQDIISYYDKSRHIFPAIGIHPWYVQTASAGWAEKMEQLLKAYPFVQIGEIGLDGLKPGRKKQEAFFIRQLILAQKYHRIAHIHCVRMADRVRFLIQELNLSTPFILHDYHTKGDLTQKFYDLNAYFSIGQHFSAAHMRQIPLNRLLIETDTQNPTDLPVLAEKLAGILGISLTALTKQLSANVKELFDDK